MFSLAFPLLALLAGFVVLSLSADRLIASAATLAKHSGASLVFIGMTVVAFGTSAPELLVSAVAALNGAEGLSVGNGIGSNIMNVGLVLGVCALVTPLIAHSRFIQKEFPILVLAMALVALLMANGELAGWDGVILLTALLAYCFYLSRCVINGEAEPEALEFLAISKARAALETVLMLALLLGSSQVMVWGAVELARAAGISELVIGLTVIAFGTSLPELAAAVAGVRRGLHDIAFATVIGSNIFNLLGVIAFPALLGNGLQLPAPVMARDVPAMAGLTAVVGLMFFAAVLRQRGQMNGRDGSYTLSRAGGGVLLVLFSGYMWQLGLSMSA
ncbi:calcium/sodium antiporter [Ferrimonas pelagia]|uniref:Calcium/sodium antiporter n=1 Tax=Ferrimonas pelagia TaxID=1177826 RepID=A0ABP9FDK7_9GAMM